MQDIAYNLAAFKGYVVLSYDLWTDEDEQYPGVSSISSVDGAEQDFLQSPNEWCSLLLHIF